MFLLYHLTDCCLVSLPLFSNHSEFIRTKMSCVSLELNASNEKIIWYPHDVVKSNFYLLFNNLDKQSPTNILCLWVCVPVFKDLIPGLPLYYSVFLAKWSNIGASLTGFFTCYCILFSFFFTRPVGVVTTSFYWFYDLIESASILFHFVGSVTQGPQNIVDMKWLWMQMEGNYW
jgi:hypothetical protein